MKTTQNEHGSIPARNSKNPVVGVVRCPGFGCDCIATVHKAQGNRKGLVYLICDECGTDQSAGKSRQEKIKSNMHPCIESLEKAEAKGGEKEEKNHPSDTASVSAPKPVSKPSNHAASAVSKTDDIITDQPDPKQVQKTNDTPKTKPIICAIIGGLFGAVVGLVA